MPVNNHRDFQYPGGYEELVSAQGTAMTAQPLPENLEPGQPKSCYYNCQRLLQEHPNLVYCEGYALADGLSVAFPHAWLTPDGVGAIDPTWDRPGTAYLGICFQTEWLRKFLSVRAAQPWAVRQQNNRDDLTILQSNHLERFSLLKSGVPPEGLYQF